LINCDYNVRRKTMTDNTHDSTDRNAAAPDTVVLVHGFWVTPRSWEKWIERYEGRGYRVLAPAYPGFEVEVEALREDPSPIEALTVPAIVEQQRYWWRRLGGVADYALGWAKEHATTRTTN
jgi:hypothetical protein